MVFQRIISQWMLTEVNVYMWRHQTRSFAHTTFVTWFITNFHTMTFNGENVNAMLELSIFTGWAKLWGKYSIFYAVVWHFILITLLRSPLLAFSSVLLHMTVSSLTTRRMPGFTLTWPGMSRGLCSSTLRATSRLSTNTRGNSRKYSRLLPRMQMG